MGRHGGDPDARPDVDPDAEEAHAAAPWDALQLDADAPGRDARAGIRGNPVRRHAWKALLLALIAASGVVLWRLSPSEAASGTLLPRASQSGAAQSATAQSGAGPSTAGPSRTPPGGPVAGSGAPPGAAAVGPSGSSAAGPEVHVVGAVKKPGLYQLAAGSRVNDAIAAAGGAKKDADLAAVNLAAPVQDGQQVRVPTRGEASAAPGPPAVSAPAPGPNSGSGASPPGAPAVVRINAATEQQLQELPGIGPALAARLIAFREQNGRFTSSADLDAVPGIGPAMLAKLEGQVSYD